MNWVHLHLALNHVSVLGSLFVLILLVISVIKRSDELKRTSLWWFFVLVLISIPIKFTGDFANIGVANGRRQSKALPRWRGDLAGFGKMTAMATVVGMDVRERTSDRLDSMFT